ncbi:hypothetical protein ALP57_04092, partial [Pseudomonas coronafaciens pv. oryzae]
MSYGRPRTRKFSTCLRNCASTRLMNTARNLIQARARCMTDKNGTRQQRRAACFARTPATATSLCPFRGPNVAIVPVRYALDRSRYDVAPGQLKPLPK